LLGATNTLVMGFSFFSLYAITKTRTGAALAVKEIIGTLTTHTVILAILVIIFSGIISFFLTKKLSIFFAKNFHKVNYKKLAIMSLIILLGVVLLVSGILGVFVLIISTLTGIYSIRLGVRRTNMMGCLIIPVIFLYLF